MSNTEITPNYTPEDEAVLSNTYLNAVDDKGRQEAILQLASDLNKTKPSIIAKLSSMKIYIPISRTNKNGKPIVKKDELVEQIAEIMQISSESLPGLEKANRATLEKILKSLHDNK